MIAAPTATALAQGTERIDPATEFGTSSKGHFKICYDRLAVFLKSSDSAMFVQHLDYWHQNEYSGYLMKDGRKWVMNGYAEWAKNFPWLTPRGIGSIVRYLEKIGWVITKRFYDLKQNVGFVHKCPALHEDNQRKWYCLDYQKIYEDTGFDLLFGKQNSEPTSSANQRKRSKRANVPKSDIAIYQNEKLQCTETAQSSYIEDQRINTDHEVCVGLEEFLDQDSECEQWERDHQKFYDHDHDHDHEINEDPIPQPLTKLLEETNLDPTPEFCTTLLDDVETSQNDETTHEGKGFAAPRHKTLQKPLQKQEWLCPGTDAEKAAFLKWKGELLAKEKKCLPVEGRTAALGWANRNPEAANLLWEDWQKLKAQDANQNTALETVPEFRRMDKQEHVAVLDKFINHTKQEFLKLCWWHEYWLEFASRQFRLRQELIPGLTAEIIQKIKD